MSDLPVPWIDGPGQVGDRRLRDPRRRRSSPARGGWPSSTTTATLWVEKPAYVQLDFLVRRLAEQAATDPGIARQPAVPGRRFG